ncbi:hypothetical protein DB88DRAFT_478818 [Papiliotrema laurentii]|uniref:Uncharacterized protein n=1 Tax=Papiliotrema laurentii TaxID=5418 RepID=A0AAD9L8Z0_PAPLA|nr:hypothetical protein DB88DRAFT_478818 [Papiliotrema laurentii]
MFAKLALALGLVASAFAQNSFSINTPAALVQCQPASISWVGGTGPFILAVIPGGQTGAAALTTIGDNVQSSPVTWNVNLASGTSITLKLTDSTGNIAYSSPLTIQAGSSSACLNASASTSGIATTGAITTTGSGSATLSATTSASGTTSTTSVAAASSASSASRASSAASSAAASSAASSASTARSSAPASASSAPAAASSTGAALGGAVAGVPAIVAGVLGGFAMLL